MVNLATKLVAVVLESCKLLPTSGIWIISCHNLRVTTTKSIEKNFDLVALTLSDVATISYGDSQDWVEISSNLQTLLAHVEEQKLSVKGEWGVIILVRVRFQIKKPVTQPKIIRFSWYTHHWPIQWLNLMAFGSDSSRLDGFVRFGSGLDNLKLNTYPHISLLQK